MVVFLFPRRGKYPAKPGDGGEATVDDFLKAVALADAIDRSLAPSGAFGSAETPTSLRSAPPPPGEKSRTRPAICDRPALRGRHFA
jgi:hypothetical protein